MDSTHWIKQLRLASFSGALAVLLGALGAHELKEHLTVIQLEAYKTASLYHFLHSLLLIGCSLIAVSQIKSHPKRLEMAAKLLWIGMICFSGSIYLLTTKELLGFTWIRFLGPITPIGGILLTGGWLMTGFSLFSYKSENK